mgnify:CR=1 FL=1
MLEFGEDLFDRVEIGAVGRQEQQSCADAADRLAHFAALMAAEIVHDNHVAGLEGWQQKLAHIGEESFAVDRGEAAVFLCICCRVGITMFWM